MTILHDTGKPVLAKALAGQYKPNYGLYIAYANKEQTQLPDIDPSYYKNQATGNTTGYARIPVTSVSVIGNDIVYTGLLDSRFLKGGKITRNTVLTTITLIDMGHTEEEDIFIYSSVFSKPIKVNSNTYITVNLKFSLG